MSRVSQVDQTTWFMNIKEQLLRETRVKGFEEVDSKQNIFELRWVKKDGDEEATKVTLDPEKRTIVYKNATYHTVLKVEELLPSVFEHLDS